MDRIGGPGVIRPMWEGGGESPDLVSMVHWRPIERGARFLMNTASHNKNILQLFFFLQRCS